MADLIDVACFGETLWDIYEAEPREAAPIAATFRRELGGAPANVATALSRLGVRASIVGGIGKDRFGQALRQHLEADGVVTEHLVELPNRTGVTFVVRDAEGEPEFLFYRHDSADLAITAKHVTPAMAKAKWALVGTSTLQVPALAEATKKFLELVQKNKGLLFVDLNVRAHLWPDQDEMRKAIAALVKDAAVVKASEGDLTALAGRRGMSWLEENARGATWLLTRGGNGAAAVGEHGQITVATKRVRCVDATGAGDAFIAGVLAVLLASDARPGQKAWKDAQTWTRALEVGNMLGAKAVGSVGAVTGLVGLDSIRAKIDLAKKK
jgi:fructokinase